MLFSKVLLVESGGTSADIHLTNVGGFEMLSFILGVSCVSLLP